MIEILDSLVVAVLLVGAGAVVVTMGRRSQRPDYDDAEDLDVEVDQ